MVSKEKFIKKWRKNAMQYWNGEITLTRYLSVKNELESDPYPEEWATQERLREAGQEYAFRTLRSKLKDGIY